MNIIQEAEKRESTDGGRVHGASNKKETKKTNTKKKKKTKKRPQKAGRRFSNLSQQWIRITIEERFQRDLRLGWRKKSTESTPGGGPSTTRGNGDVSFLRITRNAKIACVPGDRSKGGPPNPPVWETGYYKRAITRKGRHLFSLTRQESCSREQSITVKGRCSTFRRPGTVNRQRKSQACTKNAQKKGHQPEACDTFNEIQQIVGERGRRFRLGEVRRKSWKKNAYLLWN